MTKEELEKEKCELKKQVENRNCSNCRRSKAGCPNDGSCHNFSLWQPFINPQLTKAKEIIKKLYSHVFQGMGFMEINDYNVQKAEAEEFLNSEVEQ